MNNQPPSPPALSSQAVSNSMAGGDGQGTSPIAGTSINTTGIQKLMGDNYLPWRRQVTIVLKLRGLEQALESEAVSEHVDLQAVLILLETMDEAHKLQVQAETSAYAIMKNLERQYANRSLANKHRMLSNFLKICKPANESLNQHVGRLKELRAALANMGESVTDDFFQVVLINSLPAEEFGNLLEWWEMMHPSMKTMEFLLTILRQKEQALKQEESTVLISQKRDWKNMSIEERKKISKCKKCGKKGHWARECKEQGSESTEDMAKTWTKKSNEEVSTSKKSLIMNVGASSTKLRDVWILDSGATQHMCNNRAWFVELTLYSKPKITTVGSGEQIQVVGHGSVELTSIIGNDELVVTLANVSYVPGLITNLISVGAAAGRGIATSFKMIRCQMLKDDQPIMVGSLGQDDLYIMSVKAISAENNAFLMQEKRSIMEWHKALGHPCESRLKKLLSDGELGIQATGNMEKCGECTAGKSQHVEHPSRREQEDIEVGDLVGVDLGFIFNKNTSSYVYYLLCKDSQSEFTLVYPLQSKASVPEAMQELIIDFELGSGKQIKRIMSDNGSEFCNTRTRLILLKEKIKHERSAPYIPQQNGAVEREMQSLNGTARTILIQSGLGPELAVEALKTACYLKNRLPTSKSSLTPYERFVGRKPELSHIRIFGEEVQVLKNGHRHGKFEPRTANGYIVGFTNRVNTYRVFVPEYDRARVIETCDVYFRPHYIATKATSHMPSEQDTVQVKIGSDKQRAAENPNECEDEQGDVDSQDRIFGVARADQHESTSEEGDFQTAYRDTYLTSTPRKIGKNRKMYVTRQELDAFFAEKLAEKTINNDENLSRENNVDTTANLTATEDKEHETLQTGGGDDTPPTPPTRLSSLLFASSTTDAPQTLEEAITGANHVEWKQAILSELQAHSINQTWEVVKRPSNQKLVSAKWVFALKRDVDGNIDRFKARLVARGFEQRRGVDYHDTYAPVARIDSIRTLLAIANIKQMQLVQFDISTAFLYGEVKETIFMEPPPALVISEDKCLRLKKSLYGLRQAPKCWHTKIDQTLAELGLSSTHSDPCVYKDRQQTLYVCLYVDDGLILSEDKVKCEEILNKLKKVFSVKRLAGNLFVGIEITKNGNELLLSQQRYIRDVIERFAMMDAKGVVSPIVDLNSLVDSNSRPTDKPYLEAVGSLQYIANATRPDILFATSLLARFNEKPRETHWVAVVHLLRYLKQTHHYCLRYDQRNELVAYSDADWATLIGGSHSNSGVLITLGGGPIIFRSKKQSSIAQSSTEAEYIAANQAALELTWLRQLLNELNFQHEVPKLFIDNQSTIKLIENNKLNRRCKHIAMSYHNIRLQLKNRLFELDHINTKDQLADLLTKPLGGQRLKSLILEKGIMRERKRTQTNGQVALLALTIMCAIFTGQAVDGLNFERADPLVWRPVDEAVQLGTGFLTINYKPISPCKINNQDLADDSNVEKIAYDELIRLCQIRYESNLSSLIEAFARCKQSHPKSKKRAKRFVDPASIGLLVVGIITVVGWLGNFLYSWMDPGSSFNRLNEKDRLDRERDNRVKDLELELLSAKQVRNETILALNSIERRVTSNSKSINHIARVSPHIAMTAADMLSHITKEEAMLSRMIHHCSYDQASPNDYAELFAANQIRDLKASDTFLDDISRPDRDLMVIDMYYSIMSTDTKVYQIRGTPHYVNITENPTLVKYDGPMWVIKNASNNCVKAIENPKLEPVYLHCRQEDYSDPKLGRWVAATESEIEHLSKPYVIKSATHSFISCLFHRIEIKGVSYDCPHYPFMLPISTPYRLTNQDHEISIERVNIIDTETGYKTPHFREETAGPEYSPLIKNLLEMNRNTVPSGKFGLEKSTLSIPLDSTGILAILGCVSAMITIITWISRNFSCSGSSASPNEHIDNNITLSAPTPPAQPPIIVNTQPSKFYPMIPSTYAPTRPAPPEHYSFALAEKNEYSQPSA